MSSKITTTDGWDLKYRPTHLEDLIGQPETVALVKGILKTKNVPKAIGLFGPYGTGKTTTARMLASYLNCEKLSACGKCESCKIAIDKHPDVHEMNGANSRNIDDVRKLIDKARFKPRFNLRVFILDEIHQWTPQASQAFLKPLEEPPPATVYILGTTDPQKLPNAVLSRVTGIMLNLPKKEEIIQRLKYVGKKEKLDFKDEVYAAVAEGSGGHVRDAMTLLQGAYLKKSGDKNLSTKDIIRSIEKSGTVEANRVAMKIMLGLYVGNQKVVSKAVYDVTEPIPTMNKMLQLNEYIMAKQLFDGKAMPQGIWENAEMREFAQQVQKYAKGALKLKHLLSFERMLCDARTKMQDFAINERSLFLSLLQVKV